MGSPDRELLEIIQECLREGIDADRAARLGEHGVLVEVGASSEDPAVRLESVFGHAVPPFGGVFLGAEGMVGGPEQEPLTRSWQVVGVDPDPRLLSNDHLEAVVALLVAALGQGPAVYPHVAPAIAGNLAGWLPALALALKQAGAADYAALVSAVMEQADAVVALAGLSVAGGTPPITAAALDLDSPKTGIKDIADYLATHASSGIFVGRETVQDLGRAAGVPRGFGSTKLMVGNLLRSAAHFEQLPQIVEALEGLCSATELAWEEAADRYAVCGPWEVLWKSRIATTRSVIGRLGTV